MHQVVHTGCTPYECEECGARFKWSSVFHKHLRREHNIYSDMYHKRKTAPARTKEPARRRRSARTRRAAPESEEEPNPTDTAFQPDDTEFLSCAQLAETLFTM